MKNIIVVVILFLALFSSCKKDDVPASSKLIRYEVTGNYTGTVYASYTTASGSTANEQLTAIPWSKEVTYAANVTAAIIAISGNGGIAGQQVTIVVKKAGSQLSTTQATADGSGSFTKAVPAITF